MTAPPTLLAVLFVKSHMLKVILPSVSMYTAPPSSVASFSLNTQRVILVSLATFKINNAPPSSEEAVFFKKMLFSICVSKFPSIYTAPPDIKAKLTLNFVPYRTTLDWKEPIIRNAPPTCALL